MCHECKFSKMRLQHRTELDSKIQSIRNTQGEVLYPRRSARWFSIVHDIGSAAEMAPGLCFRAWRTPPTGNYRGRAQRNIICMPNESTYTCNDRSSRRFERYRRSKACLQRARNKCQDVSEHIIVELLAQARVTSQSNADV